MSIVSIIFAGLIISYSPYIENMYDKGSSELNLMLMQNNPKVGTLKDIAEWEKESEVKIDKVKKSGIIVDIEEEQF